jgi:pyrroloquinoline quinone biosynthesis protein E
MDQTPQILAMAEELDVDYVEYVQVQYYNWALLNREQLLPTLDQLKRAEAQVMEARERLADKMTIYFVINDYYSVEMGGERAGKPKACMNGWGAIHLTIAPDGGALPCQEARVLKDIDFPNVRDHDLAWIWQESPEFNKFRGDDWMKEPCRSCDEKDIDFGGCRCQAYLLTGDMAGCDPTCTKSPDHYLIERVREDAMRVPYVRKPLVRRQPGAVMTEVGSTS